MKKQIKRVTAVTLVLILILLNFWIFTKNMVKAEGANVENEGENDVSVELNQSVEKYFGLEEGKCLLQQKIIVTTNQDNLKKENEKLQIEVPKIDNKNPNFAVLLINGNKLDDQSYQYDQQTGKLETQIGENQNICNIYKVIYEYDQVNVEEKNTITLNTTAYVKIENKEEIQNSDTQDIELNVVGKNVSVEGNISKEIYKGYLYENKGNETDYQEDDIIEISSMENVKEIELQTSEPQYTYYTDENQENKIEMPVNDNIYFKKTWISQSNMKEVLGEDGQIIIQNQKDEIITQINKDTRNR